MNRSQFQGLAISRLSDARVLLQAGSYPAAYYMAGYAVECALKACFALRTQQHDFPDLNLVRDAWTHKLEKLAQVAEIWRDLDADRKKNKSLDVNWGVVKDWSVESRYESTFAYLDASDLIDAIDDPVAGVLTWIKKRW